MVRMVNVLLDSVTTNLVGVNLHDLPAIHAALLNCVDFLMAKNDEVVRDVAYTLQWAIRNRAPMPIF